jgi:hypothetical protein
MLSVRTTASMGARNLPADQCWVAAMRTPASTAAFITPLSANN